MAVASVLARNRAALLLLAVGLLIAYFAFTKPNRDQIQFNKLRTEDEEATKHVDRTRKNSFKTKNSLFKRQPIKGTKKFDLEAHLNSIMFAHLQESQRQTRWQRTDVRYGNDGGEYYNQESDENEGDESEEGDGGDYEYVDYSTEADSKEGVKKDDTTTKNLDQDGRKPNFQAERNVVVGPLGDYSQEDESAEDNEYEDDQFATDKNENWEESANINSHGGLNAAVKEIVMNRPRVTTAAHKKSNRKREKHPTSFETYWNTPIAPPSLRTKTTPQLFNKVYQDLRILTSDIDLRNGNATIQEAMMCKEVRRPSLSQVLTQETWQIVNVSGAYGFQRIFIYSAYYDAREHIPRNPTVRIFAVVPLKTVKGPVRCVLWYEGIKGSLDIPAVTVRLSRNRQNKLEGKLFSMFMFVCRLPKTSPVPKHVSLQRYACEKPTTILPVRLPDLTSAKHDFGICVVGQWGELHDQDALLLTEWIELNMMFGIGEINIYNISLRVPPAVRHVIDHYTSTGVLKIHHQKSPIKYYDADKEYDSSQLCLRTSLNDCLLRNAYRFKYILVVDRDEIVVPRLVNSYTMLIKELYENHPQTRNAPAISIYNGYFYMNFEKEPNQPPYIASLSNLHRTPVENPHFESFIPAKSFVNPQYCTIAWNHHCQIPWYPKTMAPVKYALVHHYRKGCLTASRKEDIKNRQKECASLELRELRDDFMLKIGPQVKTRLDTAFRLLNLNVTRLMSLL